jgi:putative peptidoglycan lipid II flippase
MIGGLDTPFMRILAVVFGGSLLVQLFAFLRQLVIAAAFGIDRAMDLYLLVFAVATVTSFSIGAVVENAAVPMLVARRDARDSRGFGEIANRVLALSLALAAAAGLVFLAAVPLFARFVAVGLGEGERAAMAGLAFWFLPWVMIAVPYYALGSLHKAQGRFRRFMTAEVLVTLVSLAIIWSWRPGVHAIAIAYAAGYGAGFLTMIPASGLDPRLRPLLGSAGRGIRRQMLRLLATNQIGTLGMLADRFLVSQTPAGVIAAGSYATLISGQVGALLGFRDAYMVPLSSPEGRDMKLERMIIGLLMLSVPVAAFLWWQAAPVVSVLLERGRFDRAAVDVTATMLRFQALLIPSSAIWLPMYRVLQILDRMRLLAWLLFANAAVLLVAGVALVVVLRLGLAGYLLALVLAGYASLVIIATQIHLAGVRLDWRRIAAYASYATAASAAAAALGGLAAGASHPFAALVLAGVVFCAAYLACCLPIAGRLKSIMRGA